MTRTPAPKPTVSQCPIARAIGFLALVFMTVPPACSSAPKPYSPVPEGAVTAPAPASQPGQPALPPDLLARPLTSTGENGEASFSPDGQRVLYHSKARPEHAHTQVYEVNLATMKEKRLTFHDGEDANATYHPDGQRILYSSSTDEIKEDPEFITNIMRAYHPALLPEKAKAKNGELSFQPYEIYFSRTDGSDIRRLTRAQGYDAEATFAPKGRGMVFVSMRNGNPDLYLMAPSGAITMRLTSDPNYDSSPSFSPDGATLLWVRYSADYKTSQIFLGETLGKKGYPITSKMALNFSPAWHPNGQEIIFSSNRADGKNFDLYLIDRKGLCLRRLTESAGDEILPSFSPDGRKLLFTGNQSGRNQVYMMDFAAPTSCLDEVP